MDSDSGKWGAAPLDLRDMMYILSTHPCECFGSGKFECRSRMDGEQV